MTSIQGTGGQFTLPPLDAVLDHCAVAARRIRDLLPLYGDLLGGEFLLGGDNVRVGYRGIQLKYRDGTRIELLEPHNGSQFLDRFFARNPLGGMHHVTFRVDSIERAVRTLQDRGYAVQGESTANPDWHEVFVHPREASGTLVQLAQAGPTHDDPVPFSLEDVLAGNGENGNGEPSP